MKYLAWLQATPKPSPGTRRAKMATDHAPPRLSRLDELKKAGIRNPPMPPNPMPHLVDRLIEMGLTEAGGMGAAPLSWLTIDAWQRVTGVTIAPWEARLIRRLSTDYLAMSRAAESENCPAPWRAPITAEQRASEVERLKLVLG